MASQLSLGNLALRENDAVGAIQHYLRALDEMPALARVIGGNLALARHKFVAGRADRPRLRVAVCGWELAHNAAGRVHTLARLYQEFAEVEIIGSLFKGYGDEVWPPVAGSKVPRHSFVVGDEGRFLAQALQLVAAHPYDLVHLSKPRAPNLFFGILYQLIWGARVLVDIDDEELAFVGAETPLGVEEYLQQHSNLPPLKALDGADWTRLAVGLATQFDGVTVSNPALQQRYGGEIVRHARDERRYRPSAALRRASRLKFGIGENKRVVLFCGTPREHKGLLETADAVAALGRDDVVFAIVGDFADAAMKARLLAKEGVDYRFIGNQPFDTMPEVVALGDVVVLLPDANSQIACFQVPAKLSDALGMGLTVLSGLSAEVLDAPLRRAVIKVSPASLGTTLREVLRDPRRAEIQRKAGAIAFASQLGLAANIAPLRALGAEAASPSTSAQPAAFAVRVLQKLPPAGMPAALRALLAVQPEAVTTGVSVIVLTLDAAPLLDRLLTSFFAVNSHRPVELLIVDHGSTDGTDAVIARQAQKGTIRHLNRGANFSFSDSCNFGAEQARYPQLLFLNNDIVFSADVLPLASRTLADAGIGAVGVRLDDLPGSLPQGRPPAVQHTGIDFRWNEARQYHQPEQIRHPTLAAATAAARSGRVTAVTGAFLLCRKADFVALGGFSLDYHYGLEDIDFCLRMALQLNKASWCINHLSLQHVEGATRNATPGKFSEAIERNHLVFKGLWAGTGERLAAGESLMAALALANLPAHLPTKVPARLPEKAPATPSVAAANGAAEPTEPRALRTAVEPEPEAEPAAVAWPWTRAADLAPLAGQGLLELAGAAIGLLPAGAPAAAVHGLRALDSFCALHGLSPATALRLRQDGGAAAALPTGLAAAEPASPCDLAGAGALITDAWFTTDARLRLRIEALTESALNDTPCVLRCFQFDPAQGALRLSAEVPLAGAGPMFADFPLRNPYNPLLLAATAADGRLLSTSLLPFPSLCRGGAHHGELAAVGDWPDYIGNLRRVSNDLLAELVDASAGAPALSIGRLAVDLQAAIGAEKIFSLPVKEWLAAVMRLAAPAGRNSAADGDTLIRHYLEDALQAPAAIDADSKRRIAAREAGGALTLLLAADALPSIGALVSRRLRLPDAVEAAVGPFVLAHAVTGRPRSLVSLPPMTQGLLALQARDQTLCFPLLQRSAPPLATTAAAVSTAARVEALSLPLAIKFQMPQRDHPAVLLNPLAADRAGPLLRRALGAGERQAAAVSLLVCLQGSAGPLAGLLESVSRQTLAAAVDVVIALAPDAAAERPALQALLAELFPGRHTLVEVEGRNRSADLNRAAAQARGNCYLIADEAALLHDQRTLEALYTMLLGGRVASAACVMLREVALKKGSEVRFHSGGLYPARLSFQGTPALIFNEPYTLAAFPNATYPVVGNSFRLALVSAGAWAEVGGLDALNFPAWRQDLDFCLRTLKAGYSHLCTAAVTAAHLADGGAEEHADSHRLGLMPVQRWQDIFSAVTLLREFDA